MTFPCHRTPRWSAGKAFTLFELLAVLAIVALLMGLVAGAARRAAESGRIARARAELAALSAALENYRRLYGDYPQTADAARLLQSLIGRCGPTGTPIGERGLIDLTAFAPTDPADPLADPSAKLVDPWGVPYVYAYRMPVDEGSDPAFLLYSAGPDGKDTPGRQPGDAPDPFLPENADNICADRH